MTNQELYQKISQLEAENTYLKEQQKLIQRNVDILIWGTNTAIWEWDYITGIVKFSDKKAEMLGYLPQELNSDVFSFTSMIHPEDYEYTMENMRNHLMGITDIYEVEYRIKAKNGNWIWFYDKGKVTKRDENKKPLLIVGIVNDITDKKNATQLLVKAKEKAEESDLLKTNFLNNISHEIRTPLNAIAGFSGIIANLNQKSEKLTKYSQIISSNSNKLIDKITDIIEISQIYSKQSDVKKKTINAIQFLNEIFSFYQAEIIDKHLEFITDIQPSFTKLYIITDVDKLEKIIKHLLDNAVKYTPQGCIKATIIFSDDFIEIIISDTGIGIAEDMKELVFKPFRQVESGANRQYGGTGLGLAIVRNYVQMLNGSISMVSEPNKGTSFDVKIPIEKTNIIPTKTQSNHSIKNTLTILIAEDEYDNYAYLAEILQDFCSTIFYAQDGQKAIEICKSHPELDLVLMDIKMPIMDGYTATKRIKEFRTDLPIIAQSAYITTKDSELFAESGFDNFISKPIKKELLLEMINVYVK